MSYCDWSGNIGGPSVRPGCRGACTARAHARSSATRASRTQRSSPPGVSPVRAAVVRAARPWLLRRPGDRPAIRKAAARERIDPLTGPDVRPWPSRGSRIRSGPRVPAGREAGRVVLSANDVICAASCVYAVVGRSDQRSAGRVRGQVASAALLYVRPDQGGGPGRWERGLPLGRSAAGSRGVTPSTNMSGRHGSVGVSRLATARAGLADTIREIVPGGPGCRHRRAHRWRGNLVENRDFVEARRP
jgi:hypothetical protein